MDKQLSRMQGQFYLSKSSRAGYNFGWNPKSLQLFCGGFARSNIFKSLLYFTCCVEKDIVREDDPFSIMAKNDFGLNGF